MKLYDFSTSTKPILIKFFKKYTQSKVVLLPNMQLLENTFFD